MTHMLNSKIKQNNPKKHNVLKELFGALPKLRGINLKKIRKELEGNSKIKV